MTKEKLKKKAEYIITHAVGRDEIDDFANAVIKFIECEEKDDEKE